MKLATRLPAIGFVIAIMLATCPVGICQSTPGPRKGTLAPPEPPGNRGSTLTMEELPVPEALSAKDPTALHAIPVVIIRFLPTADGIHLDPMKCPGLYEAGLTKLEAIQRHIDVANPRIVYALTEGSRFRGYKFPGNPPTLGYHVVADYVCYGQTPASKTNKGNPPNNVPRVDYHAILDAVDAKQFVDSKEVKQFWIWMGYCDPDFPSVRKGHYTPEDFRGLDESKMSSPTTGDISNSLHYKDDLPVFNHTYLVMSFNIARSQAEAIHSYCHQLESMFAHACEQQDGNDTLFWDDFVGRTPGSTTGDNFLTGRCGWTHIAPNSTENYDVLNKTLRHSDIEDWRPDGKGETKAVNADTWASIPYAWPHPAEPFPQKDETQWYVYWMQAIPGHGNTIPFRGRSLPNWWLLVADWDKAMRDKTGLHK